MRVSCRESDPGYHIFELNPSVKVKVDGAEVEAITADTREGTALVFAKNESGKPYLTPDGQEAQTHLITGHVEIIFSSQ